MTLSPPRARRKQLRTTARKKTALFNNECLEILSRLPENTIDMIFADPPYMLSNNGFTCQNGRMAAVNKGEWDASRGFEEDTVSMMSGYGPAGASSSPRERSGFPAPAQYLPVRLPFAEKQFSHAE
jgi:hypothetical protein